MGRNLYVLLSAAFALLSGCVREEHVPAGGSSGDGSATLRISMPRPVTKDMTRAVPEGYNSIDNLNIIVATGGGDEDVIKYIFYLNELTQAGVNSSVPKPEWVTVSGAGGDFGIHFAKEWFEYFATNSDDCAFFLLANFGQPISYDGRIGAGATVESLRKVRIERRHEVLFGESADITGTPGDDHTAMNGHAGGRSLKVELERLVAMVTVEIDGRDLYDDVIVTPLSIGLHNVPNWCILGGGGKRNVVTTEEGGTVPVAGAVSESVTTNVDWGSIANRTSGRPYLVGGHYTDAPGGTVLDNDDSAWGATDVIPMFLYENYHGGDIFGEDDVTELNQKDKRPDGVLADPQQIENNTKACSYLQVVARYQTPARSGTVTYRVFLGADELRNFDVLRNTYYRFTLSLRGTAIAEEGGASWRVNTNLGEIDLVGESDYVMNGNAVLVDLELDTSKKQWDCWIEDDGDHWADGTKWVYAYSKDEWSPIGETGGNIHAIELGGTRFRLWLYVAPMIRGEDTWPQNSAGVKREFIFRCGDQSGGITTPDIKITQYEPLSRTVNGRTLYVDRVDRDAAPWGFPNVQINANQPSGFENGYVLLPQAGPYIPFGEGSAVAHAALMHFYHRDAADLGALDLVAQGNYADLPPAPPAGGAYAYALPSIREWQLLERLDREEPLFDPAFMPIWDRYWSSDAAVDVPAQGGVYSSRVFQMGMSQSYSPEAYPTATRDREFKYRMIYTAAPAPVLVP